MSKFGESIHSKKKVKQSKKQKLEKLYKKLRNYDWDSLSEVLGIVERIIKIEIGGK